METHWIWKKYSGYLISVTSFCRCACIHHPNLSPQFFELSQFEYVDPLKHWIGNSCMEWTFSPAVPLYEINHGCSKLLKKLWFTDNNFRKKGQFDSLIRFPNFQQDMFASTSPVHDWKTIESSKVLPKTSLIFESFSQLVYYSVVRVRAPHCFDWSISFVVDVFETISSQTDPRWTFLLCYIPSRLYYSNTSA